MKLVQTQCKKPGFEKYIDYYCLYKVNDTLQLVRVRPVFGFDNKIFKLIATTVTDITNRQELETVYNK